ncbi:helix-turn-helix domain-containing protein [Hydrocarboniphaga effusa]|jgi:hypothetical protein|uniref:helix-turn-helix domain-containing protein n=1 Tax=Hydrocarboniphaga effusa TaxID=243629 RepID=UPI00398BF846
MAPHQNHRSLDPLYTRKEAADFLRIKPQTLAKWACTNRYGLRFVKIGSRVVYRLSDLLEFQSSNLRGALDDVQ